MPSLFIYAKVVMPIAVMLHRGEGRKRRKKKSFDSRIRDYRERSRPQGAGVGVNNEDDTAFGTCI